jgi:hypothetical protein
MKFSEVEQKHYMHNSNLKALLNEIANGSTNGKLLNNPKVVIGTSSKAKVKTSAFDYVKDGVFHSVAGAETAFTATTHDLEDLSEAVYVISCKLADDSIVITMGKPVLSENGSAVAPATPAGHLKLGEVKIVTDGAGFVAGTTELDAETLTATFTSKTDIFSGLA